MDIASANDFRTRPDYTVNSSTKFYKCLVGGACKVNSSTGGVACAPGANGVLCAFCDENWMKSTLESGRCIPCPRHALMDVLWPWIGFFVIVFAGHTFWVRKGKRLWGKWSQKLLPGKNMQPVVLSKIVLGFYQGQFNNPFAWNTNQSFCSLAIAA